MRRYTPLLDSLNLTYTQYIVMMYFWEAGKSNVKEISRALLIDPSTLTPLLKKLEAKGYITRARSEQDERNLIVKLTAEGEALKTKALSIPEQIGKCIDLTAEEAETLYNILYKVINNVEKE